MITVTQVHILGAVISSHQKQNLGSFGASPFELNCLWSHLRLYSPSEGINLTIPSSPDSHPPNSSSQNPLLVQPPVPSENEGADDQTAVQTEFISVGESLLSDISDYELDSRSVDEFGTDPGSVQVGVEVLGGVPTEWDYTIRGLVLKDVWHLFNMLYLPATHGLWKHFTRELCDAIFIPNEADCHQINCWGATQNPPRRYEEL